MKYIIGIDREQTSAFPISLEASIDQNNEVRTIDFFVDSLDVEKMGFKVSAGENGRPSYHPKELIKLYLYGYMNHIRSSRQLEKETKRNIEVIWLLCGLSPDHNTISNFRRDNPKAIKKVFRATVQIATNLKLIGGKLLAGDSTKLRAQNSKKNNYNQKKIDHHLAYIEAKLQEYNDQLALADGDKENTEALKKEIDKQIRHKKNYEKIEKQLVEDKQVQISTSDPESRQMITRNNITEVAYNVQTTVDSQNNIPIDFLVTNTNDAKAMGIMLPRAKSILQTSEFTTLYDKGYHTGSELKTAHELGIEVMVAIPSIASQAPNPNYNVENFTYHKDGDFYTCP